MKKYIFMFALCLIAIASRANESAVTAKARCQAIVQDDDHRLIPIKPTYLEGMSPATSWDSNWFIEAKGGASAFIGTPIGCGDLFDRVMPTLQVGFGKWFTPAIGGRIGYQGLKFKNADLQTMKYQFVHADFMYNLTHNLQCNEYGLSKLDAIPFVGIGMIRNSSTTPGYFLTDGKASGNHPFAFSYGIELRYLLCDRLHLVGEVSGMTTAKSFDCVGTSSRFGDHMLNASIGLSYTIDKRGWKRVFDARPYINQNDYLLEKCKQLSQNTESETTNEVLPYDKNNYSGLNSLRSRMSMGNTPEEAKDTLSQPSTIAIGVPIYFYFKLNSAKLVNNSQLTNLDEIAKIAKEQNLTIHISGAADSATGSKNRNRKLSIERARFIGKQLLKRGVSKDNIKATSLGGIHQFSPKEANRFGVILLTQ